MASDVKSLNIKRRHKSFVFYVKLREVKSLLLFIATLTHTPELCFGNPSYKDPGKKWVENMRNSAKKLGVKIHGAYICPNEHTFYFVLEADSLEAISDFLGPPILTHHTGCISPVMNMEEAFGLPFMKQ